MEVECERIVKVAAVGCSAGGISSNGVLRKTMKIVGEKNR
jgi:hypothetical protein